MSLHDHGPTLKEATSTVIEALNEAGYSAWMHRPTGSAYYGAESPQDFDILVCVRGNPKVSGGFDCLSYHIAEIPALVDALAQEGWADCSHRAQPGELGYEDDGGYGDVWAALRLGRVNMIVTNDERFYIKMAAATELVRNDAVAMGGLPTKEGYKRTFRVVRGEED